MTAFGMFAGINESLSQNLDRHGVRYNDLPDSWVVTGNPRKSFLTVLFKSVAKVLTDATKTIVTAQQEKQEIRRLLRLSDHYLQDIGFERSELELALYSGHDLADLKKSKDVNRFSSKNALKPKSHFKLGHVKSGSCANDMFYKAA